MTGRARSLREQIRRVRRHARERDGVFLFDAAPLFVLLVPLLDGDDLLAAIEHAVGDGHGAPEDLDRGDRQQTDRLEAAVLELAAPRVSLHEAMTVELQNGVGCFEATIFVAETTEGMLLGYHDPDLSPAFHAVAAGEAGALLRLVGMNPETVLPRIVHDGDEVHRVVVRRALPWTTDQVADIMTAITGSAKQTQIARIDLLAGASQEISR